MVWNDKLAKVPVVNGYMPNREVLTWDFDGARRAGPAVETLPFLPEIKIRGENLTYDDGVLLPTRRRQAPVDLGRVPADADGVVCAVSSATGVNVIRRIGYRPGCWFSTVSCPFRPVGVGSGPLHQMPQRLQPEPAKIAEDALAARGRAAFVDAASARSCHRTGRIFGQQNCVTSRPRCRAE